MPTTKILSLRREDACSVCHNPLPVRTKAQWDAVAKTVTCLSCVRATHVEAAALGADNLVVDGGSAGSSARREYERRAKAHESRLEAKWGTGRVGRLARRLSFKPASTTSWAKGARGEERVAAVLAERLGDAGVVLHDRRVPGTRGNIDHIVVVPSGVWVVDAKRYTGKVERRNVGWLLRKDLRLYVGGRDRTSVVDGLAWQVAAVRSALDDEAIPLHAALCFVAAEWPVLFAKPFQVGGVWVSWPAKLADLLRAPGPIASEDRRELARRLSLRMPPK